MKTNPTTKTSRITVALALLAFVTLVSAAPNPTDDATIASMLRDAHVVGATIAIVRDDKVISVRGYGMRDIQGNDPVDPDTGYETGSLTREFTAAAIVQLIEAGKIDLNALVALYLPYAPHATEITIRQLLNNTSGLPPYLDGADLATLAHKPVTFTQLTARIANKPLDFPPGTASAYSITNTLVLARIVETVSNQTWSAYLAQHIFAPEGMRESTTIAREHALPNMARGYRYADGKIAQALALDDSWLVGSGDLVTSANDLVKWHIALDTGRVVAVKDLPLLALPDAVQGDTLGFDAADMFFPDRHERLIVLTNTANDIVGDSPSEDIAQALETSAVSAESPSAQAFYAAAVATMDRVQQPAFVSYDLRAQSDDIHIGLMVVSNKVWLRFEPGSAPTDWSVKHRTQDYESEVIDESANDTRYVSPRPFFDPTWFGAFRALRDGMLGFQQANPSRDALTITEPTPPPDTTLHTIAAVSVIGPAIYAVQDRGLATCPNGDPGHALHLIPRQRDPRKQLSDVTVDLHSMRFCMIRFGWSEAGFFTGFVEQHYAKVAGYWVVTDGSIDGTFRVLGIKTHHFTWNYRLNDMTFPQQLPLDTFATWNTG
jgi:CubicO group peptidase (beta-lactamase class C family)